MKAFAAVLTVVTGLAGIWYLACIPMNIQSALATAARAGAEVFPSDTATRRETNGVVLALRNPDHVSAVWNEDRPRLPAPHQVVRELWDTTVARRITSKRSLVYHSWVTLSATLLGFAIGTGLGILLAVGMVRSRVMDMAVMPWAIVSQTIPIIALAPMIIVVLYSVGIQGLVPKAAISAYLSFFPVVVGMAKGLRSPERMQLDLMHTYCANASQVLWKLRLPASVPFLFASLKVGVAASLVGAIVGELPTGAVAGLGARLLAGSYYGQTIQIWSALFAAAVVAAALVGMLGLTERLAMRFLGERGT